MKKIVVGVFLSIIPLLLFAKVPISVKTKSTVLKVHGTEQAIIRSSDHTKRWVMHNSCIMIEAIAGKLCIDKKPLAVNDIIVYVGEQNTITSHTISFQSMIHVKLDGNTLVMQGIASTSDTCSYESHFLSNMKKNIEQFIQHVDYIHTDQLINSTQKDEKKVVKVLLASVPIKQKNVTAWTLQAEELMCIHKKECVTFHESVVSEKISIIVGNNKVLINGCLMKTSIFYVQSQQPYIEFNKKKYKGGFIIIKDKEKVLLINSIDLEEYIYAVVRSESWPGWPLEVNKVFAISCRSYALHLILEAQRAKKLYHIKDTNVHQRYNLYGEHQDVTVRKAVEETKGVCLTYNDAPVLAMFDSCCGGIIPAYTEAFNFTQETAYLARQYPCTFCKKTSLYSWQVTYDLAAFEKMVASRALHIFPLKKIRIHSTDKAGVVKELLLEGHKQSIKLPAKYIMGVAKKIKSCFFKVEHKGKQLVFRGQGLGHLVGLCQWGAWEMVKKGWNYKFILRYYYPSTTLKRFC